MANPRPTNSLPKLYEILGVDQKSTDREIRKKYRQLILKWHPDKNPDNKIEAATKTREISEAFQVLGNPARRKIYDNAIPAVRSDIEDGRYDWNMEEEKTSESKASSVSAKTQPEPEPEPPTMPATETYTIPSDVDLGGFFKELENFLRQLLGDPSWVFESEEAPSPTREAESTFKSQGAPSKVTEEKSGGFTQPERSGFLARETNESTVTPEAPFFAAYSRSADSTASTSFIFIEVSPPSDDNERTLSGVSNMFAVFAFSMMIDAALNAMQINQARAGIRI